MKNYIPSNDSDYGVKAIQRKISRLNQKRSQLKEKESNLSKYGYIQLGRIEEAIYIYEDILDLWME